MSAVVVRGGSILSFAVNNNSRHAEERALRPHMNFRGCVIYIMRSNCGISKPCPKCQEVLKRSGVRKAVYMNREGQVEEMAV
jgi:pyrimidine deaminase RibD-like protein